MNKLFKRLILALLLVNAAIWSIPAHSLSITDTGDLFDTDVGVLDTLIASTNTLHDSSETTEEIWINGLGLLDSTVTWTVRTAGVTYYSVESTVAGNGDAITDVFAFHANGGWDVPNPDYFIIKNSTLTALYRNLDDVAWGVFTANDLDGANVGGGFDFTISHVTEFVGTTANVPEPSISALLGIGLLGMIGVSRRRKV